MKLSSPTWTILVPVKATSRGKSRLAIPSDVRPGLALAMALDTVSAAAACGQVLAVVEDESDGAALLAVDGVVVHLTSVTGLNESISDGLKGLPSSGVRDVTGPVAVLPGDLPGVDSGELRSVLEQCSRYRFAVIPDHQGDGTTMLTASEVSALRPRYGADSFRLHQAAGAVPIALPQASTLRWDVDTIEDLDIAGGPRTLAALRSIRAGGDRW